MRYPLILLLFSCISISSIAQKAESIRSSRPGQAIEAFTVGKRVGQVQAGFAYTWWDVGAFSYGENGYETVLRYGILEKLELNALLNVTTLGVGDRLSATGLSSFHVGAKYNVYEGEGLIPSVGAQFRLKLPAVSELFRPDNVATQFTISAQNLLTDKLGLTFNTGLDWSGFDSGASWFYVVNLSHPIADRWGVFIENYGNRRRGLTRPYFDGGCSFLINTNLQLDFSAGANFQDLFNEYFISPGLSWRFL